MMGNVSFRKVLMSIGVLTLGLTVATGFARDLSDDAPFGPGGAAYKVPDPTPMFLLQAPIKTDLVKENLLNAVPSAAEILVYGGNMSQMHENFDKTIVGRIAGLKIVGNYFSNLANAFEDDFANGDGSFSDAQVAERRLEWQMYQNFYRSAAHEYAVFVYWTRGREEPNLVMIAAASTGSELNDSATVLREYFNKRREMNAHLSVVDRTHKSRKTSTSIKQINSDQSLIVQEAYCIRNNLVIYAKGAATIDDVLDRLDNPEQGIIGKPDNRFNQMYEQTSVSAAAPSDLLIAVKLNSEFVRRLPEALQANMQSLVTSAPNQEINAAAGIRFDPKSGKVEERVFVATGITPPDNKQANAFRTARLLDPARTVVYASTTGDTQAWADVFAREKLMGNGVPHWLTMDSAKAALGGEMAIVYYTRDKVPEMSDYLRTVVILEEANPKDHAKLDAWLLDVKQSCGEGFGKDGGRSIPVGDTSIRAQTLLDPSGSTDNLGRAGFEALVEKAAENSSLSYEQARAPLNFFPAYTQVAMTDDEGNLHSYVICAYSVATLRQVLSNMKQANNLAASIDFRERMQGFDASIPGVTVYVNTATALTFLKQDVFSLSTSDAAALSLGNLPVRNAFLSFGQVYDDLLRAGEPSAFKGYYYTSGAIKGYKIEASSVFGHLAPLGLMQAYNQLTLREREYGRHAAITRSKLQTIKVALDLYHISTGRYPTRDALPDLKQYLKTDEFRIEDREFGSIQTAEFLRVFCFSSNDAVLADVEQVKQPQNSNLVYIEGVEDRTIGDSVILYEAKPSGKKGTFFCLHRDGRINTMTATALAASLPPPDKIKNPYSPALVRALETAAGK